MVRWRLYLVVAVLLLLPARIGSKVEDEEEEDSESKEDAVKIKALTKQPISRRGAEEEEAEEEDNDDDEEEEGEEKMGGGDTPSLSGRRVPPILATPKNLGLAITRTTKKRPLECYVCAYKSETPLRACLDPTKFRVHTITCHSVDDKCFTSVISKGDKNEAVVRGCRSGCFGSLETHCCETNRCNNQAFAMPLVQPRAEATPTSASIKLKCIPPLFFITVLLLLQTVVKVPVV